MADLSELKQYEKAWQQASAESDFEDLPDGKYQVKIEVARFENSKNSGRLQLAYEFTVVAPEKTEGRKHWHYRGLEDEINVGYMKRELKTCGVDVDSIPITQVQNHLPNIIGSILEITIKTKKTNRGEFRNTYFNKLLQKPGGGDDLGDIDIDDENVPF